MKEKKPDQCKECGAALVHTPGRRKKIFCNNQCRNRWFNKENMAILKAAKQRIKEASD